jgi:hypothetical protein
MKAIPVLLLITALNAHALAADRIWSGTISDSTCPENHDSAKERFGDKKMSNAECVRKCVLEQHARYVFASNRMVYDITNQDAAGLEESAGLVVNVTGQIEGGAITISKIEVKGPPVTRFFSGTLERLSTQSMTIRQPDGVSIDALLPRVAVQPAQAISAEFERGDHVVISCQTIPPVFDREQRRNQTLELTALRRLRPASPEELARMNNRIAAANLLKSPEGVGQARPAAPPAFPDGLEGADQIALEHARKVNLEYESKTVNFIADEIAKSYSSRSVDPPRWRYQYTMEFEVAAKAGAIQRRQHIRKDGKPWTEALLPDQIAYGGFEGGLMALFNPICKNTFTAAGRQDLDGRNLLRYRVTVPQGGCFALQAGYQTYRPAIEGTLFVDDPGGRLIRFEYEAINLPDEFFLSSWRWEASWGDVKIGAVSYLLPIAGDLLYSTGPRALNDMTHVTVQYKNHRHFEASSNVTY